MTLDKAINPYRDDIAAIKLKGIIEAPYFVEPQKKQINTPSAFLKSEPNIESPSLNEALLGDIFEVYEIKNGFAWGQLERDNYVGYIKASALDDNIFNPSHKIKTIRTYGFKEASIKSRIISTLSLGARISPKGEAKNGFYDCGELGFIFAKHICPIKEYFDNPAQIAQLYLGAPYTWGGNSSIGVDCSGLAQNSFRACGINLPRDARMQEDLGESIEIKADLSGLKRNDLIFWQGHVAIMVDETNIIHANAYHLMTVIEPLQEANERYLGNNLPIRTIRRHK
ncbi:MAG: C40 family peptidase [Caulobacterales bacterium]|nr:C40 family peptidase [Caulobacterales bacterium]MCA0371548.1 C40 family peptidase [Pseudomonadota bacterium]